MACSDQHSIFCCVHGAYERDSGDCYERLVSPIVVTASIAHLLSLFDPGLDQNDFSVEPFSVEESIVNYLTLFRLLSLKSRFLWFAFFPSSGVVTTVLLSPGSCYQG